MKKILKLNKISNLVDKYFENYEYSDNCQNPEGIILRSFNMADYTVESNLVGIARAGAGVNNIPVANMSEKGIVVFNTPGANANAVKELVVSALLQTSRKIYDSMKWAESLKGNGADISKLVEKGKSQFVGPEIYGKSLGVYGLGAIGAKVANIAHDLGMEVYGYDPYLSVDAAWSLSRKVKHEKDINALYAECDYISLHVPYLPSTKGMINREAISKMKDGVRIINIARGELVDNEAMIEALKSGKVAQYYTDFPCEELIGVEGVVMTPHLGASTPEAEDNCAVMAARQLTDFIENGNIKNSVNYPNLSMPLSGIERITIAHRNQPNMIAIATQAMSNLGINISNMASASKGDYGYMILDTDGHIDQNTLDKLSSTEGFLKVRVIKVR